MANKNENLRGAIAQTWIGEVRQLRQLEAVVEEINENSLPTPEEIAALKVLGIVSKAAAKTAEILQESGVIFGEGNGGVRGSEEDGQPKTFDELLRVRIAEILPEGDRISRGELAGLLNSEEAVRKASSSLHLAGSSTFSRSEAVDVAQRVLTAPRGSFVPREQYERVHMLNAFGLKAEWLDVWGKEIGHDWKINSAVDHPSALAIRGLAQVRRIQQKRSA